MLVVVHLRLLFLAALFMHDWWWHEVRVVPDIDLGICGFETSLANYLALRGCCHLDFNRYLSLALALLYYLLLDVLYEPLGLSIV